MNFGALWLFLINLLQNNEEPQFSLEIWDDKAITIILIAWLIISALFLLAILYVVFIR